MRKPNDEPSSPALSDLEKRFGDEAETYAQVRAEAAAEAGNDEASDKWEDLASKLREEETNGGQT